MALQFQHIRSSDTAKIQAYKGAAGEIVVDLANMKLYVHNNVTVGGIGVAKDSDLQTLRSQVAALTTQVETLADKLNTLISKMDTYYSGYDGYPRS